MHTEASKCLSDAGECMKRTNPEASTTCYKSAVSLLCDAGKLDRDDLGKRGDGSSPGKSNKTPPSAAATATAASEKKKTNPTKVDGRSKTTTKTTTTKKIKKKKKKTRSAGGGLFSKK